ncbi:MAG: hypothetical protein R3F60_21110 [bacterium]
MSTRTCTPHDPQAPAELHPDCPLCQLRGMLPSDGPHEIYESHGIRSTVRQITDVAELERIRAMLQPAAPRPRPRVGRRRWRHRR